MWLSQPRVPQAHDGAKLATYDPKSPAAFCGRAREPDLLGSSWVFSYLLQPSWIFLKSLVCDWGDSSSTDANQLHILAVAIFKDDNLVSKYSFAFGTFFC